MSDFYIYIISSCSCLFIKGIFINFYTNYDDVLIISCTSVGDKWAPSKASIVENAHSLLCSFLIAKISDQQLIMMNDKLKREIDSYLHEGYENGWKKDYEKRLYIYN